jgi:HSP20 family protein
MTVREMMDRLFEEAFVPVRRSLWDWPAWPFETDFWRWGDNLPVDMYETDDAIVVKAALPGVREEDIDIEERNGILTIRAESKAEDERHTFGWHIRERRYGLWQRSLRLPTEVKVNKAKAELCDGILTITLPKAHAGKPLVNKIKVSRILPKIRLPKIGKREHEIKVEERS